MHVVWFESSSMRIFVYFLPKQSNMDVWKNWLNPSEFHSLCYWMCADSVWLSVDVPCLWNILLFDQAYLLTVNMWPGALVWLAGWLTGSQAVCLVLAVCAS